MPGADATRETGARERRRRKDHRPHHHRRHASNSSYDAREPILRARDGAEEARDAVDDDGSAPSPRTPLNAVKTRDGRKSPRTPDDEAETSSSSDDATPGRGKPFSPRRGGRSSSESSGNRAGGAFGRRGGRRSGRASDAEQIARMLDGEATSSEKGTGGVRDDVDDASGDAVDVKSALDAAEMEGDGGGSRRTTTWGALVAYLRCCVAPKSTAESELECAESAASVVHQTTTVSCVPCVAQPRACLEDGFVLHEGDPFIGEPDCACDVSRWGKYATKEIYNLRDGAPKYKPCLVLDLDETLVHSSFKPVMRSDFIVPVEIDGKMTDVYVLKRPWVDLFMREVSKDWEIVVFTASLPKYANPVMDLLDVEKTVRWRLFRRHCYAFQGNYVKDLTSLGRDLSQTVIVDNSPYSYAFHPQNAFPISSFIDNPNDNELLNAIPYLRELARTKDVVEFLKKSRGCMPRQSYFSRKEIEEPAYDRVGNAIVP